MIHVHVVIFNQLAVKGGNPVYCKRFAEISLESRFNHLFQIETVILCLSIFLSISLTCFQSAYCRSLLLVNPVVKSLLVEPQNTTLDGLLPT